MALLKLPRRGDTLRATKHVSTPIRMWPIEAPIVRHSSFAGRHVRVHIGVALLKHPNDGARGATPKHGHIGLNVDQLKQLRRAETHLGR
jgi:hypothetical protein